MTLPNLPEVPPNPSVQQLAQIVGEMSQQLTYLLSGFLSSNNAREFGGWQIGLTEMQSKEKTVGMSTKKTGADDIRFWAGDTIDGNPPFYVTESGEMNATNGFFTGTIMGSTIYTVATGARGIMDADSLSFYDSFSTKRISMQTAVNMGGVYAPGIAFYDNTGYNVANVSADSAGTFTIDGPSSSAMYLTADLAVILGNRVYLTPSLSGEAYVGNPLFGADRIVTEGDLSSINGMLSNHESRISALESP